MTPAEVKRVAGFVLYLQDLPIDRVDLIKARDMMVALINALVEERARYLYAIALAKDIGATTHKANQDWWDHTANKKKYRTKALRELGLEGVWPLAPK